MDATAGGHTKSIDVGKWTVSFTKRPILNAQESEDASTRLNGMPLPEICFGNNEVVIENKQCGLKLQWDALSALEHVKGDSGLKVAHADVWAKSRTGVSKDVAGLSVQKPYDWTYTTLHPGSVASSSRPSAFESAPPSHLGIPLHLLARLDIPITLYGEVPLFEDELGDNGIADLTVRLRTNSFSIFVLQRFFLRVDRVLFRVFDVRTYIDTRTGEVVRDRKGYQAPYDEIKRLLPADRPDDLTPLTDVNWVAKTLEAFSNSPSRSSKLPAAGNILPAASDGGPTMAPLASLRAGATSAPVQAAVSAPSSLDLAPWEGAIHVLERLAL